MEKMVKVEGLVRKVLEEKKEARSDDFLLIFSVYKAIDERIVYKEFRRVMRDHIELCLPSFESITRARRKLQSQFPSLKPSKEVRAARKLEEKLIKEYSRQDELPFYF